MTASPSFAPDLPGIRRLVAAVAPPGAPPPDDPDRARDALARAAWTGIAEPGDRAATLLVNGLGAWPALAAVHAGATPAGLLAALSETAEDALALPEREWAAALARWAPRLDPSAAERHLRQAAMVGAHLLTPSSPLWPAGVDDLGEHAPIALWLRGIPSALQASTRSIALVGARAATGYGEHVAVEASAGLVDRGFAIVSGAAYGIDGTAHRAALASGGTTVAILAGGVDRFYPSGHDALLARITREGAVVSELPCGSAPTRWRFLQRNRLIAAWSGATVVLEAGWRSGSLNTAGHAAALGRPLGAVPGPVTSVSSAGCHRLLREYDAVCVTNADEMAELASGLRTGAGVDGGAATRAGAATGDRAADDRTRGMSSEDRRVLDALSRRAARNESEVARRSGLSVAAVQSALGVLALEGRVAERAGGWVLRGE